MKGPGPSSPTSLSQLRAMTPLASQFGVCQIKLLDLVFFGVWGDEIWKGLSGLMLVSIPNKAHNPSDRQCHPKIQAGWKEISIPTAQQQLPHLPLFLERFSSFKAMCLIKHTQHTPIPRSYIHHSPSQTHRLNDSQTKYKNNSTVFFLFSYSFCFSLFCFQNHFLCPLSLRGWMHKAMYN